MFFFDRYQAVMSNQGMADFSHGLE